MASVREQFLTRLSSERGAAHEQRLAAFKDKLALEREKRLAERKAARIETRKQETRKQEVCLPRHANEMYLPYRHASKRYVHRIDTQARGMFNKTCKQEYAERLAEKRRAEERAAEEARIHKEEEERREREEKERKAQEELAAIREKREK
ncbi:Eukaryotic translation initiation factor 3 subunit A [Operophtera brumata]|uniref:Eukaryotic translation initiation factor 3 subunit A n=1 Tax=Operophtera brumata TaxID=104452 RepID=A0A0L7L4N0_OPEBR|nr:Eukaryotic translation initiation factor 3 subunit A [Operophtera brumata]